MKERVSSAEARELVQLYESGRDVFDLTVTHAGEHKIAYLAQDLLESRSATAEAVAAEREACADVCEYGEIYEHPIREGNWDGEQGLRLQCAAAIRARGNNGVLTRSGVGG